MPDKFDTSRPDGGSKVSVGDDALRENARTLKVSLEVEHYPFNGSLEADGRHKLPRVTRAGRASLTPSDGNAVFLTDENTVCIYNGGAWIEYQSPNVGEIKMIAYSPASPPFGWLACDGALVSRTTYAALFAKIGTAFGVGDGSTTFGLPDFKGRVPAGFDAGQTEFNLIGKTGGAKTHTLVTGEIPGHTHTGTTASNGAHTHPVKDTLGGDAVLVTGNFVQRAQNASTGGSMNATESAGAHTHTFTTDSTGGAGAHNNLQPFLTVGFVIKY